jgi:hypothetical protein
VVIEALKEDTASESEEAKVHPIIKSILFDCDSI